MALSLTTVLLGILLVVQVLLRMYVCVNCCSLTKLRRNGILQQLLYVTKHGNEVQETPLISMDMTSLAPIFTVLAFGLVATILSISLEFAIHKRKKQKQTSYRMDNDWVL